MRKIIGVKFVDNDLEYCFACYDEVTVGDFVVVDTRYGCKVVEVTSVPYKGHFDDKKYELKEVICKVDFSNFNERRAKAERFKEIKAEMDRKVKDIQELAIYEMLSEKDPELKSMLAELKTLM